MRKARFWDSSIAVRATSNGSREIAEKSCRSRPSHWFAQLARTWIGGYHLFAWFLIVSQHETIGNGSFVRCDRSLVGRAARWGFSYINMIVQMKGEELCDGVLGADVLDE